jgi:uncharacterized protein
VPTAPAAPVSESRRIQLLDALRGFALLGILLMNIPFFALPLNYAEAFKGNPASIDFWVHAVITVLFEGKMRALFGMIFGAGVILFVSKKELDGKPVAFLFYRRMFWLVVFGLIHAHLLLWFGDILYLYGLCGMLVFLFRKVKPIYLVMGVPLVAAFDFSANALLYQYFRTSRIAYVEARTAQEQNRPLSDSQRLALSRWRELEQTLFQSPEVVDENTRKMKSGYRAVASYVRKLSFEFEAKFVPIIIWDSLALMLLGAALFRWGFLTGQCSNRSYWKVLIVGYGLGLPLVIYSFYQDYLHHPNLEATLRRMKEVPVEWVNLIYPCQRILLVLAHVSAFILFYKSGHAARMFRWLAAVGRMAFTNYIMQTVICTLIFFGYGLNYYAELRFYQLFFIAAAIWAFQLITSPLWLRFFLFGPLEWVWRSLTYWRIQPFRRRWKDKGTAGNYALQA